MKKATLSRPHVAGIKNNALLTGILVLSLSSIINAQADTFKTYEYDKITTSEGTYIPPFKVRKITIEEMDHYKKATDSFTRYMTKLLSAYTGRDISMNMCNNTSQFFFLPGNTEAAFRDSEKTLTQAFTTKGFKSYKGPVNVLVEKKKYLNQQENSTIANFYIYEAKGTEYAQSQVHIHAYSYDKAANQGALTICSFSKK